MSSDRQGDGTDGPTGGSGTTWNASGAGAAFFPIGLVFFVLGLSDNGQGSNTAYLALGIVFLALSAGVWSAGSWWGRGRDTAGPGEAGTGDGPRGDAAGDDGDARGEGARGV